MTEVGSRNAECGRRAESSKLKAESIEQRTDDGGQRIEVGIQKHPNYRHDRPRHTIAKQRGLDWQFVATSYKNNLKAGSLIISHPRMTIDE